MITEQCKLNRNVSPGRRGTLIPTEKWVSLCSRLASSMIEAEYKERHICLINDYGSEHTYTQEGQEIFESYLDIVETILEEEGLSRFM